MVRVKRTRRVAGALASIGVAAAVVVASPAVAGATSDRCAHWEVSTVASGYGMLENLAFDGRGGVLLSETSPTGPGAIQLLGSGGARKVLVPKVMGAGGIVVSGNRAFFTTGNTAVAGIFGIPSGTIDVVDLGTGEHKTYAQGLVMPNGLAQLPNGDLLTTRNLGSANGITRIPAGGSASPQPLRSDLGTANGIVVEPGGKRVFVDNTIEPATELRVLDADDLAGPASSIPLPGTGQLNMADDMAIGPDGQVYVPLFAAGKILRVNPDTGTSCEIASGLPLTSAVEFGNGPGWDPAALYTTGYDGTVHKLIPQRS